MAAPLYPSLLHGNVMLGGLTLQQGKTLAGSRDEMELNNYIRISFYQIILYKNKLILKHVTHIVQTVNLK